MMEKEKTLSYILETRVQEYRCGRWEVNILFLHMLLSNVDIYPAFNQAIQDIYLVLFLIMYIHISDN